MTLVFGGTSFVAKNLIYENKISKIDCDLTQYDEIIGVLKHFKPRSVINFAAAHGSAKSMSSRHSYYLKHHPTN